jgi:RND family efflux transporter MFP subunit
MLKATASLLCIFLFCFAASANSVVDVVKATQSNEGPTIILSGTLTAEKRSLLSPRIDGLITHVNVDAGSEVKQGDILITQDKAIAELEYKQVQANVNQIKAGLSEAKRLVDEAERLIAQKHIPQTQFALRKAELAIKQAEFSAIMARLDSVSETIVRHQLIAPFSGVISRKLTEEGEWVSRGEGVLELVSMDKIRLDVNLPQEHYAQFNRSTPVLVTSDVIPKQKLAAKIEAIVPVSNEQNRTFLVRLTLDNSQKRLLPGTSAIAEFSLKVNEGTNVIVPRDALMISPDGSYTVFIVKEDKALRKKVVVEQLSSQGAVISEGVAVDDVVVIRGNEVLKHQQAVTIHSLID